MIEKRVDELDPATTIPGTSLTIVADDTTGEMRKVPISSFNNELNIRMTGGKGDGVFNNTAAINLAISLLTASGGIIFFPAGVYISDPFTLPSNIILRGEGMSELPFFYAGNVKGTTLKINGVTGQDCIEFEVGSRCNGIMGMSVFSSNTNHIRSVCKIENVLYPVLRDVEFGCTVVTAGIGLLIRRSTLYGKFSNVVVNCTGQGQPYEASVSVGLYIHSTSASDRPNANTFTGGHFQGSYKSLVVISDANNYAVNAIAFAGTTFEAHYQAGMEVNFVHNARRLFGHGGTGSLYAVKWIDILHADGIDFNGCYFEVAGYPATFNDGGNGTLTLVGAINIQANAKNINIIGTFYTCVLNLGTEVVCHGLRSGRSIVRSGDVINLKNEGAKGDGATDDTEALEEAIVKARGGKLVVPRGKYNIIRTVGISPDYPVEIIADSSYNVYQNVANGGSLISVLAAVPAFEIVNPANAVEALHRIKITGLGIFGNDTGTYGIKATYIHNMLIDDCWISSFTNGGVTLFDCWGVKLEKVAAVHNHRNGIELFRRCNNATLDRCVVNGNGKKNGYANISIKGELNFENLVVNLLGCDFSGAGENPIDTDPFAPNLLVSDTYALNIRGCYSEQAGGGSNAGQVLAYIGANTQNLCIEGNYFQDGEFIFEAPKNSSFIRNTYQRTNSSRPYAGYLSGIVDGVEGNEVKGNFSRDLV